MLRLADGTSSMRKAITDQMIMAFKEVFQFDNTHEGLDIDLTQIEKFLNDAPDVDTDLGCSMDFLERVKTYVQNMYTELLDPDHEYTFNEYGEFLMNEILLVLDHRLQKTQKSWSSGGSKELWDGVWHDCTNWIQYDAQARVDSGDPPLDVDYEVKRLMAAMKYPPALAERGDYGFILYWDCDFIFLYGIDAMSGVIPPYYSQRCTLDGTFVQKTM